VPWETRGHYAGYMLAYSYFPCFACAPTEPAHPSCLVHTVRSLVKTKDHFKILVQKATLVTLPVPRNAVNATATEHRSRFACASYITVYITYSIGKGYSTVLIWILDIAAYLHNKYLGP
jgi:hypothetical protein